MTKPKPVDRAAYVERGSRKRRMAVEAARAGHTPAEIADVLGVARNTIRSYLSQARKRGEL